MKVLFTAALLGVLATSALTSSSAHAYPIDPTGQVVLNNTPLGGNGFIASQGATSFVTFCIERNEFFNPGTSYDVSFSGNAVNGGFSNADYAGTITPPTPPNIAGALPPTTTGVDPVSGATAYLYWAFFTGNLSTAATTAPIPFVWNGSSSAYSLTDTAAIRSANAALQNAIWWMEGEFVGTPFSSLSSLSQKLVNLGVANENDLNVASVKAMNTWDTTNNTDAGVAKQSQLIVIPEASTMIGWTLMAGVFGFGARRRLLRKA